MVDEFLMALSSRAAVSGCEYVTFDEVIRWPDGKLDELLSAGIVRASEPGKGVICDQCDKGCYIEPDLREGSASEDVVGVFFCTDPEAAGRIDIPLERMKRWQIVTEKLEELEKTDEPGSNIKGMSWQEAKEKAVQFVDANGFPGIDKLREEVGCSKNTLYKAINDSRVLKTYKSQYDARRKTAKKTLKAVGLTKKILVNQEQTTEISPETQAQIDSADRDTMIDAIISKVPVTNQIAAKSQFTTKSDDEIRDVYKVFLLDKDFYTRHRQA